LDELADEDFTAAFDVHRAASGTKLERAGHLRRAIGFKAAPDTPSWLSDNSRRARDLEPHSGQVVGKRKSPPWLPPRRYHIHDGRNDFARLLDLDDVADADVLLANVILGCGEWRG